MICSRARDLYRRNDEVAAGMAAAGRSGEEEGDTEYTFEDDLIGTQEDEFRTGPIDYTF